MELSIQKNVPLYQYTTLRVGGGADSFVEVTSVEELKKAASFATQNSLPLLVIGGGSNVLISDAGFRGLVVLMNIKGREYKDGAGTKCQLRLGAGEVFDDVVAQTTEKKLWGLENLSSIPGSVGATPVQNVGAYGVEVSSLIISVEAINTKTLEEKVFTNDECHFLYRDSFFKTAAGQEWVITSVTYTLSTEPNPQLTYADLATLQNSKELVPSDVRLAVEKIRTQKFPNWKMVGTAGSFFKNPIITTEHYNDLKQVYKELPGYAQADNMMKVSLGYILDKICGLKGYCEGNVCLYEKQALVLIAKEGATASEIEKFSNSIKEKVFAKTKIKIDCEVSFL